MYSQKLTKLLNATLILPSGMSTENVGVYQALKFRNVSPSSRKREAYMASAGLVDSDGIGYFSILIALSSIIPYANLSAFQQVNVKYTTKVKVDSKLMTEATTTAETVQSYRAIMVNPDGAYVDVICSNQDSHTGQVSRSLPPLELDLLVKIATTPGFVP